MVVNSSCADEECERERKVVIEEIARMEDKPDDLVDEIFESALWPDHPIGLPIIGTRETVGSFDHAEAVEFQTRSTSSRETSSWLRRATSTTRSSWHLPSAAWRSARRSPHGPRSGIACRRQNPVCER